MQQGKILVIVESPKKRVSIQKYLDSIEQGRYVVMASGGHFCDLPLSSLGFDPETFKATYEVYSDKVDIVNRIKSTAKQCGSVVLATDDDREGEAIAYHLKNFLGLDNPDRIAFGSIEKEVLIEALKNPRKIDMRKVESQETRRLLDRMIGWLVSPVAQNYVVPKSSMGRVQTAVLWMLVDLERRIAQFKSVQHYGVEAYLLNKELEPALPWTAVWDTSTWLKFGEQYLLDKGLAQKVADIKHLKVVSVENDTTELKPHAPFITSTLQRAAQKVLKLSPKETMKLAQTLYESGAITYLRTDNPNISSDSFAALRKYAIDHDLPVEETQRQFKTKATAQQAHEAIRPTSYARKEVGEGKIQQLYDLIWVRTIASQLKAAKFDTKEVLLEGEAAVVEDGLTRHKKAVFKARGRILTYKGWKQLSELDFSETEEDEMEESFNNPIPNNLKVGDILEVSNVQLVDKKTAPPNRLTASALVARLDSSGIGRPSTFASTVEVLEVRDYIKFVKDRIYVTDRGFKIIDTMEHGFKFIDVDYTAEMENSLDEIANGKPWYPILKENWDQINGEVQAFISHIHAKLPQHKCEVCSSLVIKKQYKESVYWACVKCSAKYSNKNDKPSARQVRELTEFKCEECARKLILRKGEFNGLAYKGFSCSGMEDEDALNRCYAKYNVMQGSSPDTPDYEHYRLMSRFKCVLCDRKLNFVDKKATDKAPARKYWVCTGYKKDNVLCSAFYDDKNNEPDFAAFELNQKYKCVVCQGFISRVKKKDDGGFYWKCKNKTKVSGVEEYCNQTYDDLDSQPDYDAYQRDHEHKCFNCGSFIALKTSPLGVQAWRCQSLKGVCGFEYPADGDRPNIEGAKLIYKHKCPKCKLGFFHTKTNSKGEYFACSSWGCKTFAASEGGVPVINNKD